jgi:hypothetical protein
MIETIALFGAAGKMGARISQKLAEYQDRYRVDHVEAGARAEALLKERGLTPVPGGEAAARADYVILAVPDVVLGKTAHQVVPQMKSGAMLICLDPAAPHAGELPQREDISIFIAHPCHPPIINDETSPEGRADHFGGVAKQHIVCALASGPEEDYGRGAALARIFFGPVMNAHRVSVAQMAILEPALSETTVITLLSVMHEAMEEAIKQGAPPEAARDFLLGHMHVGAAIIFGFLDAQLSDGAKLAVARAKKELLQPDWKKVFQPGHVLGQVKAITAGVKKD